MSIWSFFHLFLLLGLFGLSNSHTDSSNNFLHANGSSENTKLSTDEEIRLWDQLFLNALAANSNTTQWAHLRQILERVETELHTSKSNPTNSDQIPLKILAPNKHPKFSYHRVLGGRNSRPFAAVTIAIGDKGQEYGHQGEHEKFHTLKSFEEASGKSHLELRHRHHRHHSSGEHHRHHGHAHKYEI